MRPAALRRDVRARSPRPSAGRGVAPLAGACRARARGIPRGPARRRGARCAAPDSSSASSSSSRSSTAAASQDGRVTLDFEIQEAITFRDGAAGAFRDLEPTLLRRDGAATRALAALARRRSATRSPPPAAAPRWPSPERHPRQHRRGAPTWRACSTRRSGRRRPKTADFDVIAATLDRIQAAAAAGEWGRAEQARLEAYGVFELGPEQRLRGLAPALFQEVEGLLLVRRRRQRRPRPAAQAQGDARRSSRRRARRSTPRSQDAEARIGSGAQSTVSVVTNSAIIVFREGLEAVLILAALMASMVGAAAPLPAPAAWSASASRCWRASRRGSSRRRCSRSLAGYGEKLEAIVSLVAIAVLLLILNWFYHRVYWQENLQDAPPAQEADPRRRGLLARRRAGRRARRARLHERLPRRLRDRALPAGADARGGRAGPSSRASRSGSPVSSPSSCSWSRSSGRLPHKKMLVATGILITWVLVVHGRDDRADAAEGRLARP